VTAADVDTIEVRDATVASGDCDIFHLNIHVVLSLKELAAESLAGFDLDCDDMTLKVLLSVNWPT
jgi:hypothetical protein